MNTATSSHKKSTFTKFGSQKGDNRTLVSQCSDMNDLKRVVSTLIGSYRPVLSEVEQELQETQEEKDSLFTLRKNQLFTRPAGVEYDELIDAATDSKSQGLLHRLLNEVLDYYELEHGMMLNFNKQTELCQQMQQTGLDIETGNKELQEEITLVVQQQRQEEQEIVLITAKIEQVKAQNAGKQSECERQQQQTQTVQCTNNRQQEEIRLLSKQIEEGKQEINAETGMLVDQETGINQETHEAQFHLNTLQSQQSDTQHRFQQAAQELDDLETHVRLFEEILTRQTQEQEAELLIKDKLSQMAKLDTEIKEVKQTTREIAVMRDNEISNEQMQIHLLSEKNEMEQQEIQNESNVQKEQLIGFKMKQAELEKLKLEQLKTVNQEYQESIRQQVQEMTSLLEQEVDRQRRRREEEEEGREEMRSAQKSLMKG